jgi:hypothetical protein
MHRIIIPVDFSETALNATRYTAAMMKNIQDVEVILYNNYEAKGDKDVSAIYLETLKREMTEKGVKKVQVEQEMGGDLIKNISRLAHTMRATLINMGISEKTVFRQAVFGSNVLKLIDHNLYPVMVIPHEAKFKSFDHVAFLTDYKNVKETTPVTLLQSVLEMFNPQLHIVNIHAGHHVSVSKHFQEGKEEFQKMFSKFKTEFYFITRHDFFNALDDFIRDFSIDVLIAIPRHHASSASIFRTTHTKKLAFHSHIPILAAH